ncbi:MAG TPA: hypothetical protein VEW48_11235 [Thermoanaerobaculia bacterium]|nr:hypothetical protein [Thermoanaerobaculia bacterium]
MAEPIRKPVHRPRPPHPHTQKRPHAVLVRSRLLDAEPEIDAILPRTVPIRPTLVPVPEPAARPTPPPAPRSLGALAPPDEPYTAPAVSEERSSRSLLLAALALHLGVLLAAWFGQPAPDLDTADLLLSGVVLLSGGTMLVLGGLRRPLR